MRRADLERDAAICRSMAADLNAYLQKDILYWALSDPGPRSSPYPQLTLGGLLMRLHHLQVLQDRLSPAAYETFARARESTEQTFGNWRVHLENKLLSELRARIRAWSFFVADCAEERRGCQDDYPTQAEVRTMAALLLDRAAGVRGAGQLQGQLHGLDRRLRDITETGPFVWDPLFEAAYPPDPFWWLYANVIEQR